MTYILYTYTHACFKSSFYAVGTPAFILRPREQRDEILDTVSLVGNVYNALERNSCVDPFLLANKIYKNRSTKEKITILWNILWKN